MTGDKLRFRFAKTGTLRLLSHHDLMRCLERMLRRASLPFKSTAGFHPSPRVVFALSLPLGVVGWDEVVEIEFNQPLLADDILLALNAQAPVGLAFTCAGVVSMRATAVPRRVVYRLAIPPERVTDAATRAANLLTREKVWIDRIRPTPKQLNIRPYVRGLWVANGDLILDLWVTQTGTARADELVQLLDLGDVIEAGAVLERTIVEVRDEVIDGDSTDSPPDGPADILPLDRADSTARAGDHENQPAEVHWGASPSGPVVE